MRRLTKLLSMLLVLILTFTAALATGCSKDDDDDGTTTVIKVEIVDVGYGTAYLENLATRFETKVANKSYEENKLGVDVRITPYKGPLDENKLIGNDYDLFFGSGGASIKAWMANGSLLNINDIATETLTEYGETRSIKDKFYDGTENMYCYNNEVYALPMFMLPYGIMYNVDIWEEYKLYFNESNNFATASEIENKQFGTGPDGYDGTYDDGLPRTYEEFFKVLDKLKSNCQPIVWDGKDCVYYLEDFVESLHMNAEPIDQYMLNLSFSGNATTLVDSIDGNGNVTLKDSTAISNNNGYELFGQAGAYYATQFMSKLLSDDNYWNGDNVFSDSYTNLDAQLDFLKTDTSASLPQIAMLIEGAYWEQESYESGNFNRVQSAGERFKRENRRIAYLPMPMPTLEMVTSHKGHNLVSTGATIVAASANIDVNKIEAVKDFIQFCFTDQSLVETTKTTSMFCAYDYDFEQADYDKLSFFGKSIADYMTAETTNVRMATSSNNLYMENATSFSSHNRYKSLLIGGSKETGEMFSSFKAKDVSAKDYFLGMKNRMQGKWSVDYSKYINN